MNRPADRHPEAAWQTLRDRDASERAVHNARQTLGLRDDEFARIMRRAHVRPEEPPFAWLDTRAARRKLRLAWMAAAVLIGLAVGWWAMAVASEVNRIVLEQECPQGLAGRREADSATAGFPACRPATDQYHEGMAP